MTLAQTKPLFERFNFDSSYRIIGVCSQLDEKKEYQKWTFIISDTSKLRQARQTITCKEKLEQPTLDDNDLEMYVTKDKEVIETYYISPKYHYVNYYPTDSTPGVFQFDISQLLQLADVKPLNSKYQNMSFKTQDDLNKFLATNKMNKKLLCYEDVSEEQNGKFTITIPKSRDIQKFKDGWALIEKELNRYTSDKKDYLMSFNLSKSTDSTFFYQINTSKTIYNKFNLIGFHKSSWTANLIEITVTWLK
ncbi:MAG: hypothetical protein JSR00_03310 [Bacteroidetes bacterium]|nr:hypothetical protein [Bacteroidota bacterium]